MTQKRTWRTALGAMAIVSLTAPVFAQDLMITSILDATLPGGEPKVVELFAINAVPDLSRYALSRAGNGAASFDAIDANRILPNVALNVGDFYYAVGNSFVDQTDSFDLVFPAKTGIRSRNFGVNSNGNDVTGLFFSATGAFAGEEVFIDVVGELGVDGIGEPWEHQDSYLYSNNGRTPTTTFNVGDWIVPGNNVLDNLTASQIANEFPDMTFTQTGSAGDEDGDGDVDGRDLLLIQRNDPAGIPDWEDNYGTGVGPLAGISAVPEPSSIVVLIGLAMCLVPRRGQR